MSNLIILALFNGLGLFGLFYVHTAMQSVREHTIAIALVLFAGMTMGITNIPLWEDARLVIFLSSLAFLTLVVVYGIISFGANAYHSFKEVRSSIVKE